jgi:prepilin-type N-terminal cleavage/methylation domain-containing protein
MELKTTSAISARSGDRRRSAVHTHSPRRSSAAYPRIARSSAFTLIELLVVMAVIVILVSIAIPVVFRSQSAARRMRTVAELQAISIALEAYKNDFGDYPRVDLTAAGSAGMGSRILGKALIAPGPAISTDWSALSTYQAGDYVTYSGDDYVAVTVNTNVIPDPSAAAWLKLRMPYRDGANGAGFRPRDTQGKVYGPYLNPELFKTDSEMQILDLYGKPILYYPAAPAKPNINTFDTSVTPPLPLYVTRTDPDVPSWVTLKKPLYDVCDNYELHYPAPNLPPLRVYPFTHTLTDPSSPGNPPLWYIRFTAMLGDFDSQWDSGSGPAPATAYNGVIDAGETSRTTAPYLLWSAGADGVYGPEWDLTDHATPSNSDISACDDVTNFQK